MLIDAEPLIREYKKRERRAMENGHPRISKEYTKRLKDLMRAPEAVVHCKDCKWYLDGECVSNDVWCNKITGDTQSFLIMTEPDDFCSCGERRRGGTE